ncbi:MAG: hypothetical protein KAJ48_08175 [Elusimicrobiales bacterium]|nr:hypothetical protein [Elusimicrobiales bacterium]
MKKDQKEENLHKDLIERMLGNTHRCKKCNKPIDLTINSDKETPDKKCPNCNSRDFIELAGLEKCLILQ